MRCWKGRNFMKPSCFLWWTDQGWDCRCDIWRVDTSTKFHKAILQGPSISTLNMKLITRHVTWKSHEKKHIMAQIAYKLMINIKNRIWNAIWQSHSFPWTCSTFYTFFHSHNSSFTLLSLLSGLFLLTKRSPWTEMFSSPVHQSSCLDPLSPKQSPTSFVSNFSFSVVMENVAFYLHALGLPIILWTHNLCIESWFAWTL